MRINSSSFSCVTCQLYDKCHLAKFYDTDPSDTVQKSQLIDKAVGQYMGAIDSFSLLI